MSILSYLSASGMQEKLTTAIRHAFITAAAFGVMLLCQSLLKIDFGPSTIVVDSLLAAVVRFLTTYVPDTTPPVGE